jgi:CheY-like chemotaxis protein
MLEKQEAELWPGLILLDLNLRAGSGFEVLTRVRGLAKLAHIPVVVFTSLNATKDRNRAAATLGASAYVRKPSTFDGYRLALKKIVEMILSIPVKWGTDSAEVGQRQSKATLAMAMISEVPHLSQEFRDL